MLDQQTIDKMREMKLTAMADGLERQARSGEFVELSFEERLGLLIDQEYEARENRKLTRRLRDARLRYPAALEDVDFSTRRGLDRRVVMSLATCRWIRDKQNLLITGPTGSGKTYLACAFVQRACRSGYRATYVRAPRLLQELEIARGDGSYARLLAKLARVDLLAIDDWLLTPLSDSERQDLLEVLEDRSEESSSLIATQLPVKSWHEAIGEASMGDAICDRLIPGAHKIAIKGPSMRQVRADARKSDS
jgi:DNA replication protein DnaC